MTGAESLAEHQTTPRNMGRLSNADAVGTIGSIVIGRALRFFLKLDDGVINEAKFQVFACNDQIGSSSALTELLIGQTASTAAKLTRQDIAAHLDCDPDLLPIDPWGLAGLQAALRQHDDTPAPTADSELSELLCRCHAVTKTRIDELLAELGPDQEAIATASGAGTGCGSCRRDLANALTAPPPDNPGSTAPTGRVSLLRDITEACDRLVAMAEDQDGRLELWDLRDKTVVVRLHGSLAVEGPLRSGMLERLDRTLKDDVDPLLSVEVDS